MRAVAFLRWWGALGLALVVHGNVAAQTNEVRTSPDIARIQAQGKIVVAMHVEDGEPFYWIDKNGQLTGLDVDIARDIATNLGVQVEFNRQAETFDGLVDMVAARKADIAISCLSRTPKRALKVLFTQPYVSLHYTLILNRLKTAKLPVNGRSRAWLNSSNIRLGTVRGSSYVDFVERYYPKTQLLPYDTFPKAAEDVVAGRIHAVIFDDSMVAEWSQDNPAEALYVEAKVMKETEDPISIAVHWEDRHLLSWLNDYLKSIESDGMLPRLREKYLGEDRRTPGRGE